MIYTATPTGPFKIANFWSVGQPGDELILEDGLYRGPDSMLAPPIGWSGQNGAPVRIHALSDGKVRIDGESQRTPVLLRGNKWLHIQGINAANSDGAVVYVAGDSEDNTLERMCAWNAGQGNYHVFSIDGSRRTLIQDFAGWGRGRKIAEAYNGSSNTFRRGWAQWNHSTNTGTACYEMSYGSQTTTFENCIGTIFRQSGERSTRAFMWSGSSSGNDDSRLMGSIAYALADAGLDPECVLIGSSSGGNYADVGADNVVALLQIATGKTIHFNDVRTGFVKRITCIGGTPPHFANWTRATPPLVSASPVDIYNNPAGATILKCYVNRVLTEEFLFPWRMDERIRQARIDSGFPSVTSGMPIDNGLVTSVIEQLFGVIPPEWRWDSSGQPIPPDPEPIPPIPPEPTPPRPQRRKFNRRKDDR